jgi:uncharacterized membrane protein YcaP (DUF421 family)
MNKILPESELPLVLVSDGKILEDNLERLGHDRAWLNRQMAGGDTAEQFLVMGDSRGIVYRAEKGAAG